MNIIDKITKQLNTDLGHVLHRTHHYEDKKPNKAQKYIYNLQDLSSFTGTKIHNQDMLNTIKRTEKEAYKIKSCELFYEVGVAYRNYCAWYVRGDERKVYLEKSVDYFKEAYNYSSRLPFKNKSQFYHLDKTRIIGDLCNLLVNQRLVRDYRYAEPLLIEIMAQANDYEPIMCSYIQLLYAEKRYDEALDIAHQAQRFINASHEWNGVTRVESLIEKIHRKIDKNK